MQMIRLHVKKRDTERKKNVNVDLDEKIRRIREENKAREKRFKEIEADKIQASGNGLSPGIKDVRCEEERSSENEQGVKEMKGHFVTSERKMAKGRGQRLLEMSKEPLKAKDFEAKARESLKSLREKPSKERFKAKDFESMARVALKTRNEKNNRELALKAKDFESKAREFLKTVEEKKHPNEIKLSSKTYLSTEARNKPNKVEYFTNQGRFKEKNDSPLCSDIPGSGYINPLMDSRYLDKPKTQGISNLKDKGSHGNNAGCQSCTEKDAEIKGKGISIPKEKGGGSYGGGKKDHTKHKDALDSGLAPGRESIRQENTSETEDWCMEVMNLDESKMEPICDTKLGVTDLPCKELKADSYSHEEESTDISLFEGAESKDKNNIGFNEWRKPQLDNIPEVSQSSAEQLPTVSQNNEGDVKNDKVPPNKETKEELEMCAEVAAPVLQNNALKEQAAASTDKINKTKPKEKDNRPKVTLNTKIIKKTLSNSSFEDGIFLLSPLEVPTNWGDLDFSDDDNVSEAPGSVFYPTLRQNNKI